jgi:hypothetical protein
MRPSLLITAVLLIFTSGVRATQAPDPVLVESLRTFEAQGIEAGLHVLYAGRSEMATEMKDAMANVTRNLGSIIDTEIVAIQPISKRVRRYYVAIYFTRCPVWLRIERYENKDKAFYLPLRFSTNPDQILPGYLTEFNQQ